MATYPTMELKKELISFIKMLRISAYPFYRKDGKYNKTGGVYWSLYCVKKANIYAWDPYIMVSNFYLTIIRTDTDRKMLG